MITILLTFIGWYKRFSGKYSVPWLVGVSISYCPQEETLRDSSALCCWTDLIVRVTADTTLPSLFSESAYAQKGCVRMLTGDLQTSPVYISYRIMRLNVARSHWISYNMWMLAY
jgi:hypothetical protein